MSPTIQIRIISAEQTRPLRHRILRPNQDFAETLYPMDTHAETFHIGAIQEGKIVGVLSMYPENREGRFSKQRMRLRGMAVDLDLQNHGIGRQLVHFALTQAEQREKIEVWCNARTSAVGFYQKLGFAIKGEEFEIAGIGPHYVMSLDLKPMAN